jgi:pyridoxal phosphate enzyme (YggS family)
MVKENLALCLEKLKNSVAKAGYSFSDITLVAVTKAVPVPRICEAIDYGVRHIGENKIQEALLKFKDVNSYAQKKGLPLTWHMLGHLQTNKVSDAVKMFDLIHSVDSVRLAEKIDKEAHRLQKVQEVLLEVKTSDEATKYGFAPEELKVALEKIAAFKNIKVKGLMTIAPPVDGPGKARPYFRKLKKLADEIFVHRLSPIVYRPILSMGMTDDFQAAVSEGANMVRIGRGIFGERKP